MLPGTGIIQTEMESTGSTEQPSSTIDATDNNATAGEVWLKKVKIRQRNLCPDYDQFSKLIASGVLQSNLKKCTGFTKKIKIFASSHFQSIMKDLGTLNLSKYLSEIAKNIIHIIPSWQNDMEMILAICSEIHQKYSGFSNCLLETFLQLSMESFKQKDEEKVVHKLGAEICLLGEVLWYGIIDTQAGFPIILNLMKQFITLDSEASVGLDSIIVFCQNVGHDLAGLPTMNSEEIKNAPFDISSDETKLLLNILQSYFTKLCKTLRKYHNEAAKSVRFNKSEMRRKGEVSEEHLTYFKETSLKFETLRESAQILSNLLNESLPKFKPLPKGFDYEDTDDICDTDHSSRGLHLFEDEETRQFYQDILNLQEYFAPIMYRDCLEASEQIERSNKEEQAEDLENPIESNEDVLLNEQEEEGYEDEPEPDPDLEVEKERIDTNVKISFRKYLDSLENAIEVEAIDKAAVEFVENFNTKSYRKRLTSFLAAANKKNGGIIRPWSRLIAELVTIFPNLSCDISLSVMKDFHRFVRVKSQFQLDTKIKISRFIGELVKFRILPTAKFFVCLKILLHDFSHHNIDMACSLLETCGVFLYRSSPQIASRMKDCLEQIQRKRNVRLLDPNYVSMIDNAIYTIFPPELKKVEPKKKPILHRFISHLLTNLVKDNFEKTLLNLRRLDWMNLEVVFYLAKKLARFGDASASTEQMRLGANLIQSLYLFYPSFSVRVHDNIISDIEFGLKRPAIGCKQRRMSTVKYFGELFVLKLIRTEDILKMLNLFISDKYISHDSYLTLEKDFRVRLACVLARKTGTYFSKQNQLGLYNYLQRLKAYFQTIDYYSRTTGPYSTETFLEETLDNLLPEDQRKMLVEISLDNLIPHQISSQTFYPTFNLPNNKRSSALQAPSMEISNHYYPTPVPNTNPGINYYFQEEQRATVDPGAEMQFPFPSAFENYEMSTICEEDEFAEFFSELDKMRNAKVPAQEFRRINTDIPVPLKLPYIGDRKDNQSNGEMRFVVMTKNKNKSQLKPVPIDFGADFIQSRKKFQEAERAEKDKMKQLTLKMTRIQEEEEQLSEEKLIKQKLETFLQPKGFHTMSRNQMSHIRQRKKR